MVGKTDIEWTDKSWNPSTGCDKVSQGCKHCYAETVARGRLATAYSTRLPVVRNELNDANPFALRLWPERLEKPLQWQKPSRIFVNSMSDLFHPDMPEEFIDQVFAVMALAPQHTYQVLTKRPELMAAYISTPGRAGAVAAETGSAIGGARRWPFIRPDDLAARWPLCNVWLGTSVEDQAAADERVPHLLASPAVVHFLSCEPLLGPVTLPDSWPGCWHPTSEGTAPDHSRCLSPKTWVICGGESGPGARPMHPEWPRALRDQCREGGIPFFFKQWGAWAPETHSNFARYQARTVRYEGSLVSPVSQESHGVEPVYMCEIGKARAGRILDGRTWDAYPT